MATLDDFLDVIRRKENFVDLVEVTDNVLSGSKLKRYEAYFGKPGTPTITVEHIQIYVNGTDARIVAPCFLCNKAAGFRDTILPKLNEMKQGADKVRVLFVDEDEKFAVVEKTVYNQSTGTGLTRVYKLYELPDRSIRVVES